MKKFFIVIALLSCSFGFSQSNRIAKSYKKTPSEVSISKTSESNQYKAEILLQMNWSKEVWEDKVAADKLSPNEKIKIRAIMDSLRAVRKDENPSKRN